MDFVTWALCILTALGLLCFALYTYLTWNHSFFKHMQIPGPKPGLFGVVPDYKTKGIVEFDTNIIKKYGRIVGLFHFREPAILISDPEFVKQICVKEFNNFVNRRSAKQAWPGRILNEAVSIARDDHWKVARSVLSPTFSSSKMRSMSPLIQRCCDYLVAAVRERGQEGKTSLEVRKLVECFTMNVIASTGFGMDVDAHNHPEAGFVHNAKICMKFSDSMLMWLPALVPWIYDLAKWLDITPVNKVCQEFFFSAVTKSIQLRNQGDHGQRDLLQLMLNAHMEGPETDDDVMDPDAVLDYKVIGRRKFTETEVLANSLIFLLAGYDTTSSLLTWACHSLAVNPQCQQRLLAEIRQGLKQKKPDYDNVFSLKYLDCVVNETLRMYPPATRTARTAEREITINGLTIPAGTMVLFPIYAMHHDPDFWTDPETFDPERFLPENRTWHPYAFLPFGAGPRNCIGMRLALLEAKMALAVLVSSFDIQLDPGTEVKPKLSKSSFLRPENPLQLRFVPRDL